MREQQPAGAGARRGRWTSRCASWRSTTAACWSTISRATRRTAFGARHAGSRCRRAAAARASTPRARPRSPSFAFGPLVGGAPRRSQSVARQARVADRAPRHVRRGAEAARARAPGARPSAAPSSASPGIVDDPGPQGRGSISRRKGSRRRPRRDHGLPGRRRRARRSTACGADGRSTSTSRVARRRSAGARPPAVIGTLRGRRTASFRYPGAPAGVDGLSFHARFAPDSLGIGDLAARVAGQPVTGRLSVTRFADPRVRFAVRGNVDLAAVGAAGRAEGHQARRPRQRRRRAAAGRAADPGAMALEGGAELADVSVEPPRAAEEDRGRGRRHPLLAGARHASPASPPAPASRRSTLDATVTRPLALHGHARQRSPPAGVDFTLRSPYLDLAELLPADARRPARCPTPPAAAGCGSRGSATRSSTSRNVHRAGRARARHHRPCPSSRSTATAAGARQRALRPHEPGGARRTPSRRRSTASTSTQLLSAWTPAKGLLHGSAELDRSICRARARTPAQIARTLTAVRPRGDRQRHARPRPDARGDREAHRDPGRSAR